MIKCECDGCEFAADRDQRATFCKLKKDFVKDSDEICQVRLDEITKRVNERRK